MAEKAKAGGAYSRRQFLINTAKMAGAVAAFPILSSPIAAAASAAQAPSKEESDTSGAKGSRTLGLLLPRSAYYTDIASNFLAGMSLYFGQAGGLQVSLITEETGTGASRIQEKLDAMLSTNKLDMVIGMMNPSVAASVCSTLEAAGVPLLASSVGENMPRTGDYSSNIYYHTLGMWQSNWALGQWAAANLGTSAVLASSSFDSGYDAVYAFRAGFEGGGGRILASPITHSPGDDSGFAPMIAAIRDAKPSFVFAGYYGQLAVDFLNAYAGAGLSGTPVIGSSFLTEQQVLQSTGRASGVKSAFSWLQSLEGEENRAFVAGYQSKEGKNPNSFALLGYEAAQIVAKASSMASANKWSLSDALGAVQIASPRGTISMSKHSTTGPVYLQEVARYGKTPQNVMLSPLNPAAEQDARIAELRDSVKSGWLNTYLCE